MIWDRFFKRNRQKNENTEDAPEDIIGPPEQEDDLPGIEYEIPTENDIELMGEFADKTKLKEGFDFLAEGEAAEIFDKKDKPDKDAEDDISEENILELSSLFDKMGTDDNLLRLFNNKSMLGSSQMDQQIESLLAQRESEDDDLLAFPDLEFIADRSTYDTEIPEIPPDEEEDLSEKIESLSELADTMSSKVVLMFLGGIGSLVIILLIIAVVLFMKYRSIEPKEYTDGIRSISQPAHSTNDTNFIYVYNSIEAGSKKFMINKMVMDGAATVFYLDQPLDFSEYGVELTDQDRNTYAIDFYYHDFLMSDDDVTKLLRFAPLKEGINGFTLTITEKSSGEADSLVFELSKPFVYPHALYLNKPVVLSGDEDGITFTVTGATFASSGTSINFRLDYAKESGNESISIGGENGASINVFDQGRMMLPYATPTHHEFKGDGFILGRIDLAPVKNLSGQILVEFGDIVRTFDVDRTIDTTGLFQIKPELSETIKLGRYNVILEAMEQQGNIVVLVLHSEDTSVEMDEADDPVKNRVETKIDVDLVVKALDGSEYSLPGKCMSMQEGSDILFTFEDQPEWLTGVNASNASLHINSIMICQQPIKTAIGLSGVYRRPSSEEKIEEFISGMYDEASLISYNIDEDSLYATVLEKQGNKLITHQIKAVSRQAGEEDWRLSADTVVQ